MVSERRACRGARPAERELAARLRRKGIAVVAASMSALAAFGALRPPAALAEPTAADRETARTLMKKGDQKFAAKDYAGALKDYQAAHAVMLVPITGLAVGKAQAELGLLIEAHETLLQVGRLPQDPYEAGPLTRARDEAATLAQKLANRIPSVTITVAGPTTGVEVQVDGAVVPAGALSAPRKANPGSHVISASAVGYAAASSNIVLKEGANEKVVLKLVPGVSTPQGVKPVEGGGVLHIASPSEPGNVFLDGRAVGATPLDVPATAGKHEVEIQYPGGSHDTQSVDVKAGATAALTFQPSTIDALARPRKGMHFGISGGPSMSAYLVGGPALYGGTASFVLNVGITPLFDFRTGLNATFHYNSGTSPGTWELTVVVPALLKVNYTPWFSAAAGLSVGFIDNQNIQYPDGSPPYSGYVPGYAVGPEWSPFIMSAGDKRQFELGIMQGVRFGNTYTDFHQAVTFTYLFLD